MQLPGYRIIRKINQGGMSTVYLAVQLSVSRQVALKVMSPIFNADPVFSKRFQREATIVGQLSHPNIVSIYDIGCHKNLNYIAMDYLPGGSVHDKMRNGLSTNEVLTITREVALALDVAHEKGFVHRDIKPENILFKADGTSVLSDFGVAKIVSAATRVTNAGMVVGTPHYMSPEQSRGLALDGRSDFYSLGIVFYEMLTGVVPFQAEEAVAIAIKHLTSPIPKLPAQHAIFQNILNKLLAKSPKERFQNGGELIAALDNIEQVLSGQPNRRTPFTDPSEMNVMTLLRALVITSYAAIRLRASAFFSTLFSWRWTPNKGFYVHPKIKVTEIRTDADTLEENKRTVISTRIQKAAHYEELTAKRLGLVTRVFMFAFVATLFWSALSVGFVRYKVPSDKFLPDSIHQSIVSTAYVVQNYADRAMGRSSQNSIDETATTNTNDDSKTIYSTENFKPEVQYRQNDQESQNNSTSGLNIQNSIEDNDFESTIESPVQSSLQSTMQEVKTYGLTVSAMPSDARIRVLNIRERYADGIQLKPGRYSIEISKPGYHTIKEWRQITNADLTLSYQLKPNYRAGDLIIDPLKDGSNGPEMVVVNAGIFTMGKQGVAIASPVHEVTIPKNLAVSKYEITFAQFQKFVDDTGGSTPSDNKWGQGSRPVINVSWQQAVDFAQWLSEQTGNVYRLPSEAEWEYFARANTNSDYWWGNQNPNINANCKRGCDSEYAGTFSSRSAPVGSFPANAFGLHDTSGNVAEWVADCFQNHYSGAPIDGSAVELKDCPQAVIRGGAMNDNAKELYSYSRQGLDKSSQKRTVGFRLVRELD